MSYLESKKKDVFFALKVCKTKKLPYICIVVREKYTTSTGDLAERLNALVLKTSVG